MAGKPAQQLNSLIALIPVGCPLRVRRVALPTGYFEVFTDDELHLPAIGPYAAVDSYIRGYVRGWRERGDHVGA